MKTSLILVLTGALIGIAIASWVVPPALSWYTAPAGAPPGVPMQTMVQIPEIIRYATGKLIRGQQIGAAIGAILGLTLGIVLAVRARRKRQDAQAAATAAAPQK